jgi:putative ABC transport system permease protein
MPTVPLDYAKLTIAGVLVLACGLLSVALRLRLERELAIGAARTVVQLLLIGHVLRYVFAANNLWLLLLVSLFMIAVAAHAAGARLHRTLRGLMGHSFIALLLSSVVTTFIVTEAIIRVPAAQRTQYVIPLLGMILGNALTGVALSLDVLLDAFTEKRAEIENELALGASSWEAARGPIAAAVRRGMIPQINAMNVVGLVSLPGMMTGQILAGADPLQSVKYQIVVMFMVTASTTFGCVLIALSLYRRLFTAKHQLAAHLIEKRS